MAKKPILWMLGLAHAGDVKSGFLPYVPCLKKKIANPDGLILGRSLMFNVAQPREHRGRADEFAVLWDEAHPDDPVET